MRSSAIRVKTNTELSRELPMGGRRATCYYYATQNHAQSYKKTKQKMESKPTKSLITLGHIVHIDFTYY